MVLSIPGAEVVAQDYFTVTRRDEVGPRELDLDEETFLNILSFEQPLQTLQPWLADDNGFRTSFGSLDAETFYDDTDLKLYAPVSDVFGVRIFGRRAIDFDSRYFLLQFVPEFQLSDHWYFSIPLEVDSDKGEDDAGLALGYRDRMNGIDFIQVSFIRADPLFENRSDDFPDSRIPTPSNNLELQMQVNWGAVGKTTLKVARQFETEAELVELGRSEEYQRSTWFFLHALQLTESTRLFFRSDRDAAVEAAMTLDPLPSPVFDSSREYLRNRIEIQHDLRGDDPAAVRFGIQQLYFEEREVEPGNPSRILRREYYGYGAYRTAPLPWLANADLETALYLGYVDSNNDIPMDPERDGRDDPFQAKLNIYLRWVGERTEFVLTPSVGLDRLRWGGGGAALRFRF